MKALATAAVLSLALAGGAQALTVTNVNAAGALSDPYVAGSVTLPNGASWQAPAPPIEVGSLSGQYRTPFEGGAGQNTAQFFNVLGGTSATLLLSSVRSSLSLLWGSVDTYNAVDLYLGGNLMATITSANMTAPQIGLGAEYVTIAGQLFDKVVFRSNQNSMEFATVSAVPLPAGVLMLLGALGALAAVRRRNAA